MWQSRVALQGPTKHPLPSGNRKPIMCPWAGLLFCLFSSPSSLMIQETHQQRAGFGLWFSFLTPSPPNKRNQHRRISFIGLKKSYFFVWLKESGRKHKDFSQPVARSAQALRAGYKPPAPSRNGVVCAAHHEEHAGAAPLSALMDINGDP